MDWSTLLPEIMELCIIPLLAILTSYLVSFIKVKKEELKTNSNNELFNKYMDMLSDTITSCVLSTNQTYVDSLKNAGSFDLAAQKRAFENTKNAILTILSTDAQTYLSAVLGDFELFLTNKIEETVKLVKE